MNIEEVKRLDRNGGTRLLYSHDDGFTRHVVEIHPNNQYVCRLNEVPCFRRRTHEMMAKLYGFELNKMHGDLRHWLQV